MNDKYTRCRMKCRHVQEYDFIKSTPIRLEFVDGDGYIYNHWTTRNKGKIFVVGQMYLLRFSKGASKVFGGVKLVNIKNLTVEKSL